MPEIKHDENESALPSKRKPIDTETEDSKKQKLEFPDETNAEEQENDDDFESFDDHDDDDDDEEDDDDEHVNGEEVVDRKGKGIMKDDKGKGKLIEEDDDEDDDSDTDCELDEGSDLSEDSLAEVDLDNILPSRTRRKMGHLVVLIIIHQPSLSPNGSTSSLCILLSEALGEEALRILGEA